MRDTSRAVILPTPVDPFMLNYWLWGFNNIWGEDIDHLYITVNSPIEDEVIEYVRKITDNPKITLTYIPNQIEHGDAINRTLELVKEKNIMLVEDDCYIFQKGQIGICFDLIEGDIFKMAVSKRGSCHPEILERAKEIWGLNYEGYGDQGCNFWPNLFFSSKELLLKTDRNFGAKAWHKGEIIKELDDYVVKNDVIYGDTFVWASLQLRSMVPEAYISYVPQYHGHPDDIRHYEERSNLFTGRAGWCHIGSLSSGIHGLLTDDNDSPLAYRINKPEVKGNADLSKLASTEMEKKEFERRIQWWLTFVEFGEQESLKEFRELYKRAIVKLIAGMGLSMKNIRRRQGIYKSIGLW